MKADSFSKDVLAGLTKKPKALPCKYLYDETGIGIYQKISKLEEYYLIKDEFEIIEKCASNIAECVAASNLNVIELGPGDGSKAGHLLPAILESTSHLTYYPFDISPSFIDVAIQGLPKVNINPLIGDYTSDLSNIAAIKDGRKIILFLGSSIGNLTPSEANQFLNQMNEAMSSGDMAIIGFDRESDPQRLQMAYDDPHGVTRDFNLNLLHRINRELGGQFKIPNFVHMPKYNSKDNVMESYLQSTCEQVVNILDLDREITFKEGETIHTESSYKFSNARIDSYVQSAGFELLQHFYNQKYSYSLSVLLKS